MLPKRSSNDDRKTYDRRMKQEITPSWYRYGFLLILLQHIYLVILLVFTSLILLTFLPVTSKLTLTPSIINPNGSSSPVLTRDVWVSGYDWPHPELCPAQGENLQLLIMVMSAPANAEAREAVRLTWRHLAEKENIAFGFLLGMPPPMLMPALREEDEKFGDILLARFVDSYANLTLKTLAMLEWTDKYCSRAPRLLKTEDDMFINVPRLLSFMASPKRANATRKIWGKLQRSPPDRDTDSKYYVSEQQFPEEVFPLFATGPAYMMTMDVVQPLLEAALIEPYLPLEDVFVTGLLAERIGVNREHASYFHVFIEHLNRPCEIQFWVGSYSIYIHKVGYQDQFYLLRKLLDGASFCEYVVNYTNASVAPSSEEV